RPRRPDQLILCGCACGGNGLDDSAAIGSNRGVGFAGKTTPQLVAAVACINHMRVRIHEPWDHAASTRVDARCLLLHGHGVNETNQVADVGDATFKGRDDAVVKWRNLTLREAAPGRWTRAGGNQIGVFDEKVRLKHADSS